MIDFAVQRLDFGVFADILMSSAATVVVIDCETADAPESYRLARFVKMVSPGGRVAFVGPHSKAMTREAFALGEVDLVCVGNDIAAVTSLFASAGSGEVREFATRADGQFPFDAVLGKTPFDTTIAPAYHAVQLDQYAFDVPGVVGRPPVADLACSFEIFESPVRGNDCPTGSAPLKRKDSAITRDIEVLLALGICHGRFVERDFLAATDGGHLLLDALAAARLPFRWFSTVTVESIPLLYRCARRLADAGCSSITLDIGSGDAAVRSAVHGVRASDEDIERAIDALTGDGIQSVIRVSAFCPGEALASWNRTTSLLERLGESSAQPKLDAAGAWLSGNVKCAFHRNAPTELPGKSDDGIDVTSSWSQHVDEHASFVPRSLLNDVPVRILCHSDEDARHVLRRECRLIERCATQRLFLPSQCQSLFPTREALELAALSVWHAVDGQTRVEDLFHCTKHVTKALEVHCGLLSLLSVLGLVSSTSLTDDSACGNAATASGGESQRVKDGGFFCSRPWTGFEVGEEDGVVRMCCWAMDGYGNINDSSIADIWNGPPIRRMRRAMAEGAWEDICRRDCPYIAGYMTDPIPEAIAGPFRDNLELSLREIDERREVLTSLPRFWKVAHSTLCNLDCIMCYQDRSNKQVLPETFYSQLPRFYGSMQELLLMGGEPFAIRRIRELIDSFPHEQYPDTNFAFITNGTVFDAKTMALVSKRPISWVVISVDAARPETYAHIRRNGVLTKTTQGIRAWKALSDSSGFPLVLSFTVMRDNAAELTEFVRFAHELGVDCQFSRVSGTKGNQHLVDEQALRAEANRALEFVSRIPSSRLELARSSLTQFAAPA